MLTLGICADTPRAATGMAVVNHNLAYQLSRLYDMEMRTIYFARFERGKGVAEQSSVFEGYEIVSCEGGVWKEETVKELIDLYNVDILYSEDDWWSMEGLIKGTQATKTPFYFMTPIDSLPIQREAKILLEKYPYKVFVPNMSYKYLRNGVKLRHAVDTQMFKPVRPKMFKEWTFLWIGRDENRKALGRAILAWEKIRKKHPCKFVVRSNWGATPMSRATYAYIKNKNLPIIMDRMMNCPHEYLAKIYSGCNAFLCTSKAGACEMSILEAQACTLPVLATDWTFMSEQLVNKKAGWKIPIESYDVRGKPKEGGIEGKGRIWGNISVDELAKKMVWMIENQDKAINQGYWSFDWVRKNFNWKDVAQKFFDTIIEDLEKRKLYKIVGEI